MDEFSYNSFKDYFDLINISSLDWQNELLSHKPDFFFLESAWKGHNYQWEHKINRTDDELLKLLTFCREKTFLQYFGTKKTLYISIHFFQQQSNVTMYSPRMSIALAITNQY